MSEAMTEDERQALEASTTALQEDNAELKKDLDLKTANAKAETENTRLLGAIAILDSTDADVVASREARAALEAQGIRTT